MIISDINHLEVVEAANVVGGGYPTFYENDYINSNIDSHISLRGNVAESYGTAQAIGNNTFTKTVNDTSVVQGFGSFSEGASVSAAGGW
jgi:hypothetical protein